MAKVTCSIDGCENAHNARGWCNAHYLRWRRNGDPLKCNRVVNKRTGPDAELNLKPIPRGRRQVHRLTNGDISHLRNVLSSIQTDECVLWKYGQTEGYPGITVNGKRCRVHVLACEFANGARPTGMQAAHDCGNRLCFNPRHLLWKTHAENQADAVRHGVARGSKLNANQVHEIRWHLVNEDLTRDEMREKFGVQHAAIRNIRSGRHWMSLKTPGLIHIDKQWVVDDLPLEGSDASTASR